MDRVILELEELFNRNPALNYKIEGHNIFRIVTINQGFKPLKTFKIYNDRDEQACIDYVRRL